MSAMRRLKWHPPLPPTPRIIHLPRRPRRKQTRAASGRLASGRDRQEPRRTLRGKLSALFREEQRAVISRRSVSVVRLSSVDLRKRGRVREEEEEEGKEEGIGRGIREEKWKFQAEILRAECNFLRADRDFALKKLERNRVQLERTLGSAVQTLISGRKKIREGKSVGRLLEEEIEKLAKKLRELRGNTEARDLITVRKCSNFDKQAFLLQKRMEKIGGVSNDECMKQIQKIAESSLSSNVCCSVDEESLPNRESDSSSIHELEIVRRKMERQSKGMSLEKMEEELGSVLSTTIISSAALTSSTIPVDHSDSSSSSSLIKLHSQGSVGQQEEEESTCEGQCKAVVRRVMEQVRAETEQWTQMQQILAQVREEMEGLEASRDFWEEQALHSNSSLRSHLKEWKSRAIASEAKAIELQAQVSILKGKLEKLRRNLSSLEEALLLQSEKEKRVLICQLKENHQAEKKDKEALVEGRRKVRISGHALKDIANVSPLLLNKHHKK